MALYFEILNGEQSGQRFSVRSGMTLGRRNTDVTLQDSKVSGRHASVTTGPEGGLFLVDEGSSNGIKVDGRKVREVELLSGAEFQIGRTLFRIVEMEPADAGEIIIEEPKTWQQIVAGLAVRAMEEARPSPSELAAFHPPLILKFIQGVQAGTEWTIGYGPREVGPHSLDLVLDLAMDLLWEQSGSPALCFRLVPRPEGVLLQSTGTVEIKLNGRSIQTEYLNDGDELDIQTTRIRVSLST